MTFDHTYVRALIALPLAAAILAPASVGQGLVVSGYANVEYVSGPAAPATFDAHNLNLIFLGRLRGDLFAAGEVEYEHGGDEIALEYAYLAFTRFRYVNIIGGKFIVPFGSFNVNHPAWINKVPGRPFGLDRVLPTTYSDVGLLVRGGIPAGYLSRITYDVWIVNGLSGDDGGDLRDMRDNNVDADHDKFMGGRLGYVSRIGLDVGGSVHTGKYLDTPGDTDDLRVTFFGVDATFQWKGLELKGEFVQANQDATTEDLEKRGFYAQAAYLVIPAIEPAVRFSRMEFPGDSNRDVQEISAGLSIYLSDFGALRLFGRFNRERSVTEVDNDQFIAQLTVGF